MKEVIPMSSSAAPTPSAALSQLSEENAFIKIFLCSKHRTASSNERLHRHKGWSLFYNISGAAHVAVMQKDEVRVLPIQPGQFVFLSSLIPHRLRIGEADDCYMIHLTLSPCREEEAALSLKSLREVSANACRMMLKPFYVLQASDMNAMLSNTLTEILLNFESARKEADLAAIPGLLLQIMLMEIVYLGRQSMASPTNQHVNKAVAYLKGHGSETVRIADVAKAIGIHPVYLQRIFKEHMHKSITEYLMEHRIQQACRMLRTTSFPLIDIALDCGFTNRQHFTRCFKQILGVTPSVFRRENQLGSVDTEIDYEEVIKPGDRFLF